MPVFMNLAVMEEDDRISVIGKAVMSAPTQIIAFVIEDDAKADRYVEKLQKRFPDVRIIDRFAGPVPDTVTVRVSGPLQ